MSYKHLLPTFALLLLVGCTSARISAPEGMVPYDDHTAYSYLLSNGRLRVDVVYERYQFMPETTYLVSECKAALQEVVSHVAASLKLRTVPPDDKSISSAVGRNGVLGVSSCNASTSVEIVGIAGQP